MNTKCYIAIFLLTLSAFKIYAGEVAKETELYNEACRTQTSQSFLDVCNYLYIYSPDPDMEMYRWCLKKAHKAAIREKNAKSIAHYYYYQAGYQVYMEREAGFLKNMHKAGTLYRLLGENGEEAKTYNDLGEYYNSIRKMDSARIYLDKGLLIEGVRDAACYPTLLTNLAASYFLEGDNDQALPLYLKARQESERMKDSIVLLENYSSLGVIYRRKEMLDSALYCYNKGLELTLKQKNNSESCVILCNIAVLYSGMLRFQDALDYADKAIKSIEGGSGPTDSIAAYSTKGSILKLMKRYDEAIKVLRIPVNIARKMDSAPLFIKSVTPLIAAFGDLNQSDSVRHYLKEAEAVLPRIPSNSTEAIGLYETKGRLLQLSGQYQESLAVYQQLLRLRGVNSLAPLPKLYRNISDSYKGLNQYHDAYEYLLKSSILQDSLTASDVSKQMSDMKVKYKTKEQELAIAGLEQILSERKKASVYQIILFIAILFALYYYRQRQNAKTKLELTRTYIDGLENERIRLAKELHDGVCSDLLGLEMQMKAAGLFSDQSNEKYLSLLSTMRTNIRDISHELMPPAFQYATIDEMLSNYADHLQHTSSANITYYSSEGVDWKLVDEKTGYEIYRIAQEALNNILKHNGASHIKVELLLEKEKLEFKIMDDGREYRQEEKKMQGIGLRTIQDRVKSIRGNLEVARTLKGTCFNITVKI